MSVQPEAPAGGSDPRGQRVSCGRVLKQGEKALHHGASEPRLGHDEIVVLVLSRDEAESVLPSDCLDRDAPIGAVLRDGNTHALCDFGCDQ